MGEAPKVPMPPPSVRRWIVRLLARLIGGRRGAQLAEDAIEIADGAEADRAE